MQPLDRLIALFGRRWAVPVLVELGRDRGCKLVTLCNRLGVGRETLRVTLDDLGEQGLVNLNPGYGHPMRPEYVLTADGLEVARRGVRLLKTVRRLDLEPLAFRKWTLPITWVIGPDSRRFGELRDELGGITPRALALSLKSMNETGLVRREVYDDYPPVTSYSLARRARPVYSALVPLARAV